MRNKLAITQALIAQLPPNDRPGINHALETWWKNTRRSSGLRLTTAGNLIMKKLSVESYRFNINPDQLNSKLLLLLDQRLQDPYFLKTDRQRPWIEFYGSQEALLANLYGDLTKFLENYSG